MIKLTEEFWTPRVTSPQDSVWKDIAETFAKLSGVMPDDLLAQLRDGAERWKARAAVPVEEREADPVLEGGELAFVVSGLSWLVMNRLGNDFYNLEDLPASVRSRVAEIAESLEQSPNVRISQVMLATFKAALVISGARYGYNSEIQAVIRQALDYFREFYSSADVEALNEVMEREFSGKLPQ